MLILGGIHLRGVITSEVSGAPFFSWACKELRKRIILWSVLREGQIWHSQPSRDGPMPLTRGPQCGKMRSLGQHPQCLINKSFAIGVQLHTSGRLYGTIANE